MSAGGAVERYARAIFELGSEVGQLERLGQVIHREGGATQQGDDPATSRGEEALIPKGLGHRRPPGAR